MVPSRETSNTGKSLRLRPTGPDGCSPRRADSDSAAPTERFRSPAINLAASRISLSMFGVVLAEGRATIFTR